MTEDLILGRMSHTLAAIVAELPGATLYLQQHFFPSAAIYFHLALWLSPILFTFHTSVRSPFPSRSSWWPGGRLSAPRGTPRT